MKIDFIAQIEGVEKTMPIIKASAYRHKWMIKMAQDYKKFGSLTQRSEFEGTSFAVKKDQRHTSKCPGIIDYRNQKLIKCFRIYKLFNSFLCTNLKMMLALWTYSEIILNTSSK